MPDVLAWIEGLAVAAAPVLVAIVASVELRRRRRAAAIERPRVVTPLHEPEHYNCRCVTYYQPMAQSGHRLGHPVVTVEAPSAEAAWAALVGGAR
jgi:hypothetical protein